MIKTQFKSTGLQNHSYIIKVSYGDVVGINHLLNTKLDDIQVASLIASYMKPSYTLDRRDVSTKKFPGGYYESFSIDNILSLVSRLRFVEVSVVKEPRIVYIDKVVEKEL
jgi:hypothetical protein